MEVLACIPELPCLAGHVTTPVCEPPQPAGVPVTPISTPAPAFAVAASEADDTDVEDRVSPAPRHGRDHRSRSAGLFSPSIITLAALAVVVWAAAWRNDRLRLEASRQQRPERLAQELQPAGTARSVTP